VKVSLGTADTLSAAEANVRWGGQVHQQLDGELLRQPGSLKRHPAGTEVWGSSMLVCLQTTPPSNPLDSASQSHSPHSLLFCSTNDWQCSAERCGQLPATMQVLLYSA
jgi:hypothetical protein